MLKYEEYKGFLLMISDSLLAALRDINISTNRGFVDYGSPLKYKKLEVLGYITAKDKGYVINENGVMYLQTHKKDLLKL